MAQGVALKLDVLSLHDSNPTASGVTGAVQFFKATGIEAMIERKRAIQDQERASVKRAALAELEKSQRQEEESLKRQYEIMMRHGTASKRLEEKLKIELGIYPGAL